jgi:hypothetical protein
MKIANINTETPQLRQATMARPMPRLSVHGFLGGADKSPFQF